MNVDMNRYLRMGTVHFMSYPDVLQDETQIVPTLKKLMADPYFSVIEMAPIRDETVRREVRELFAHSDCALVYTAAPKSLGGKMNLNSEDTVSRQKDVEQIKQYIDEAIELGAEGICIIAGHYDPEHFEEAFLAFVDSCQELCRYAEKKPGFRIEVEQFDYDFHNKLLIGSSSITKRLAQAMSGYDNFGILVDLSHIPLIYETPRECLETLKGYVTHVHIGNAVCSSPADYLYGDFHPRFSLENSAVGVNEVVSFLEGLFETGYFSRKRPIVSFEIKAWTGDNPDMVLAECKRMMNLAWSILNK